jgi:hypothetical protein
MTKWLLLVLTCFAIYGVLDSIGWLSRTKKLPAQEIEKVVGYDASHLPLSEREQRANTARSFTLNKVVVIMAGIALALATTTFKAFFP